LSLALSWVGVVVAAIAPAKSQEWPRLADGRVVVDVKGTAVALPSTGPDLRDIRFNLSYAMNLKWVIESPFDAREVFKASEQVHISIPNVWDRAGSFLGRFPRIELQQVNFSIEIGGKSQGNCRAWERSYDRFRAQLEAGMSSVDSDGWAEFEVGKSPKQWTYLRVRDASAAPRNLDNFNCDWSGTCSASVCIGSDKAFGYQFNRKVHGRESWNALVQKARDVLQWTLIDTGISRP
jgi:hypothetical protein